VKMPAAVDVSSSSVYKAWPLAAAPEELSGPVYVQEVYVMDGFMRSLASAGSPREEYQETIPVPCVLDEPLENVKRRLFEAARANFVTLQDWTESELKWYVYQNYEYFLDARYWKFYGPDLEAPTELFDELKVSRVKGFIAKFQKVKQIKTAEGMAKPTHVDAIYLLPTHLRVMLWREGYGKLMYTLDRDSTFEDLRDLVEADLNLSKGTFTNFDVGTPKNLFGPGKSFADVLPPTTTGVSHAWA